MRLWAFAGVTIVGAASVAWPRAALAEAEPVRVRYSAPAGCSSRESFVRELAARTSRVRASEAVASATFTVELTDRSGGVAGQLRWREPEGGETVRAVSGATCEEVCVQQMRRFGIDLLYPTSRYASGLLSRLIEPRMDGVEVENPLYAAGADGTPARDPSMVYLAGIVGVPWQDISTEDSWTGRELKFMTAEELQANGRWDVILGPRKRSSRRTPT